MKTERDIGYLIKIIDERLRAKADADLKEHHLTMAQGQVLTFLYKHDGQATQKEIELFLSISHPAVVGIVSRMEQNGHLTTWFDPKNRRNKIVQMTPDAASMVEMLENCRHHWEQTMLQGFDEDTAVQLQVLLARVCQNLA